MTNIDYFKYKQICENWKERSRDGSKNDQFYDDWDEYTDEVNSLIDKAKTQSSDADKLINKLSSSGDKDDKIEEYELCPGEEMMFLEALRNVGLQEATYQGKDVELNKPFRDSSVKKKFSVYVKDGDKVKKVSFGDSNMEIKRDDKENRDNFRSRFNCDSPGPNTKPRYWSCKMWQKDTTVSDMTG